MPSRLKNALRPVNRLRLAGANAVAVALIAGVVAVPATAQLDTQYLSCQAQVVRAVPVSSDPLVYGVLIRNQRAVRAARVVINTTDRSYVVTFADLPSAPSAGNARYITLGDRTAITSVWVDRAGSSISAITGCSRPIPDPGADEQMLAKREADAGDLLRAAYSRTSPVVAATDLSDVRPLERCYDPTTAPHRVIEVPVKAPKDALGRVVIVVQLNADNRQTGVGVAESSGRADVDKAVVDAAWNSRFMTESVDCRPRASSYRYTVEYKPRGQ